MNRGAGRNFEPGEAVEYALAFGDERAQLAVLRLVQKRREISAGDEYRLLGRGDDNAGDR